ncbi:MAG: hypothetical protein MJ072_06445, partial [Clostridia bacterium]|nr:hypothetical protein [Clostridia bacterium]
FACLVFASLCLSLEIYRLSTIPKINLVKNTGTLVVTSVAGTILFAESPNYLTAIRIGLMVIASVLLFLGDKKTDKNGENKPRIKEKIKFFILILCLVADGCLVTLLTKSFATDEKVTDANSFYFFTNVIIIAFGVIWLIIVSKGKLKNAVNGIKGLKPSGYFFIIAGTLSANVISLITVPLVAILDVASFSAYTSALTMVGCFVASVVYRERQSALTVVSVCLAALSCLLSAI